MVVGQTTNLSVGASEMYSGVIGGEYYIGSNDPGQGNATPLTWNNNTGTLTATLGSNLTPGTYSVNIRAENAAGSWSAVTTTSLVVNPIATPVNLTALTPTNKSPNLSWSAVSGAASYNIYRGNVVVGNTSTTSYTDSTAVQESNTYYVAAVSANGIESNPSNTITVIYDTTAPTITYSLSPASNSAGWNNSPVTVIFSCNDSGTGVGIATCTAPVTLNSNGSHQTVIGTAVDNAGNTTTVTTTAINIDQTVPMVGTPTWSVNPVIVVNNSTVIASVSPSVQLSPIIGGEYYIGTIDPGQGHGTAMAYDSSSSNLTANLGSNLPVGTYPVNIRAENAAGIWSSVITTSLVVKPLTVAPTITSANTYSVGVRQIITTSDLTITTTGIPAASVTESGTLPSGLTFTDNGNGTANFTGMIVAGTAGTYNLTIKAANSAGTATQQFTLTITNATSAPTTIFSSSSNMTFTEGSNSSYTFIATGNGSNFKIFVYSGTLPPGLNLHDNKDGTASFFGTPTKSGTYTFTLEAENKEGITYQQFTVTVS